MSQQDDFLDHYKTLGVNRTATDKEIQQAFRDLRKIYHPDTAPHDKIDQYKKISSDIGRAYEALGQGGTKPNARATYDQLYDLRQKAKRAENTGYRAGASAEGSMAGINSLFRQQSGFGSAQTIDDIFAQMFGGRVGFEALFQNQIPTHVALSENDLSLLAGILRILTNPEVSKVDIRLPDSGRGLPPVVFEVERQHQGNSVEVTSVLQNQRYFYDRAFSHLHDSYLLYGIGGIAISIARGADGMGKYTLENSHVNSINTYAGRYSLHVPTDEKARNIPFQNLITEVGVAQTRVYPVTRIGTEGQRRRYI